MSVSCNLAENDHRHIKDGFKEMMNSITRTLRLLSLKTKWKTFHDAWEGDKRGLLEDRLGGHDLGALVRSLDTFLKGEVAGHATKACLDKMHEFLQLSVENTTDGVRWNDNDPIEIAFHAARRAMRTYQIAILTTLTPEFKRQLNLFNSELPAAHALRHMQGLLAEL